MIVGDAAAGLGLHFLHMSEGPFLHDAGQITMPWAILIQGHQKTISANCYSNLAIGLRERDVLIFLNDHVFQDIMPLEICMKGHLKTFSDKCY